MAGYRLPKQKEDTHVCLWRDPRGPGHGDACFGTIVSHIGDTIVIEWYDGPSEGVLERWASSDLKYRVDRGQAFLKPPPKQSRRRIPKEQLACRTCGTLRKIGCDCPRVGALKPEEWGQKSVPKSLTKVDGLDRIVSSSNHERSDDAHEKGAKMATKTEPLSAKEAAKELGTDARTLRKFLRKKNGLVGQGQRWAIDPKGLKKLKKEFDAWNKGAEDKAAKAKKADPVADDDMEEFDTEVPDFSNDDELDELEDLEFDEGDDD